MKLLTPFCQLKDMQTGIMTNNKSERQVRRGGVGQKTTTKNKSMDSIRVE